MWKTCSPQQGEIITTSTWCILIINMCVFSDWRCGNNDSLLYFFGCCCSHVQFALLSSSCYLVSVSIPPFFLCSHCATNILMKWTLKIFWCAVIVVIRCHHFLNFFPFFSHSPHPYWQFLWACGVPSLHHVPLWRQVCLGTHSFRFLCWNSLRWFW